jgi:hypothetical protein
MEKLVQQNPLVSPPSSSPSGTGVTNLHSTPFPFSPPSSTSPINSTQSRPPPRNIPSPRMSETSEVIVYPSSVSLRVCINTQFFFFSHINDKV